MLWQLHKSKYIRFKNIYFSIKKNSFQLHCQLQILWSYTKSFPMRKKSGAHHELTVTSWWDHCELTVTKMQSRDQAVSSPWSKCSPWQFVFSWDFHTDLVLHASSVAPFGTDFDHLVQKAICHKYKVTRIPTFGIRVRAALSCVGGWNAGGYGCNSRVLCRPL